jgi:hypothetical protein
MIPARYVEDAIAQGFVENEEIFTLPASTCIVHSHTTRYSKYWEVFSICVVAEMSLVLSDNRHKTPLTIANSLCTF